MPLTIHAISDTHNQHKKFIMPGGDVAIHAGDATGRGHSGEILPFLDWYAKQDYSHLVLIAGNHDWGFAKDSARYEQECKDRGIILLNDSGCEIEGIKVWGSPVQPWFHNWAYNKFRGDDIKKTWDLVPESTEILITHGPAYGILDYIPDQQANVGCQDLLNRILETQVKLHICGHIHCAKGILRAHDKLWANVSALDDDYKPVKGNPTKIIRSEDGQYSIE